jgi:hypothetical protein
VPSSEEDEEEEVDDTVLYGLVEERLQISGILE